MKKVSMWRMFFLMALLIMSVALVGCEGDDGDDGAPGAPGESAFDPVAAAEHVEPESCETCHTGVVIRNGSTHQEFYDELFQQGVVVVSNVAYNFDGANDVVTFEMTKMGMDFDCTQADSLDIYFTEYTGVNDSEFTSIDLDPAGGDPDGDRLRIGRLSTLSYDMGTNVCTSSQAASARGDLDLIDGIIVVYGQDEELEPLKPELVDVLDAAHVTLARFPFAAILNTGAFADNYVSAANVTGCENCHTVPYFKHGYITGDVSMGGGLDFYTCKACHIDNGSGGHVEWQLSEDNPQRWAEAFLAAEEAGTSIRNFITDAEKAQYAYTTRLMNDVHMSHAMEFPYPQSLKTCNTCHEGKLVQTLSDANFILETCVSCHPITGGTDTADAGGNFAVDTRDMALKTYWADQNLNAFHLDGSGNVTPTPCNNCHNAGPTGIAKVFSAIHDGYDDKIYGAPDTRYRDEITVSIDSVTVAGTDLEIQLSATGSLAGLDATAIVPEVYVAFYGYDSKDFLISNHKRGFNNGAKDGPRFEFEVGVTADNALFTTVDGDGSDGTWAVTAHMAGYESDPANLASIPELIADGTIKKAEVAINPVLRDADGVVVGLNAVSRTVDVTADAVDPFVDDYYKGNNALASVRGQEGIAETGENYDGMKGCNSCHDHLGTTFHTRDSRGGNITVCRMCHVVTEAGSHIADQSRSLDSYVHAVHSFQFADVDEVDFTDPVEEAEFEEHISFLFPDFATFNCEACHTAERAVDNQNRAPFDIPAQDKSMPGVLSGTDEVPGIPDTPEVVTGPAARACGGCHRAQKINTQDASGLESFNQHTKDNGYRIENDADDNILHVVIKNIMSLFQ